MNKITSILLFLITLLTISCSNDALDTNPTFSDKVSPLVIYASIDGTGKANNRAVIMKDDDRWSYVDFVEGDVMGFYSSGGNWIEGNGKGSFKNLALKYKDGQFTDPGGVEFSPSHMDGSQIFMYYPYYKDMEGKGFELHEKDEEDTLRCIDFLSSNSITLQGVVDGNNVALYGKFQHAFSELIIMRGEGFDNPPAGKERITAVLNKPYTNLQIDLNTDDDNWSCVPRLIFDENNSYGLNDSTACRWDAWEGGNYGITVGKDPIGKPAWYVIVPTLAGSNRSIVEYIELYDNEGYLQRVSSLKLSGGNTKYVDPQWRYPMEITMKELVPTVNPFPIIPWNDDDINLTDERTRGINNIQEFADWVRAYNAYLLGGSNDQEKIDALLKYGDSFIEGGNRSWHFYVLSDLDFTNYSPLLSEDGEETDNSVIIPNLNDILDGISTTFVNGKFINHTIKGLSKTFIDLLKENGSIQNFDFIDPEVKNSETSTDPAGIIVNTMDTGTSVVNCNIDNGNLFNPGGPAGMVAGSMTNGLIKDCILSGFLVAKTSFNNIVGTTEGSYAFPNSDASDVIDSKIQE